MKRIVMIFILTMSTATMPMRVMRVGTCFFSPSAPSMARLYATRTGLPEKTHKMLEKVGEVHQRAVAADLLVEDHEQSELKFQLAAMKVDSINTELSKVRELLSLYTDDQGRLQQKIAEQNKKIDALSRETGIDWRKIYKLK